MLNITYFGHSCFLVDSGKVNILFDPFIKGNELAKGVVSINEIKTDYIFISHGHDDHTADFLEIAKNNDATLIANWEICSWAAKNGHTKSHPMNIGGTKSFEHFKLKMTAAVHSSSFSDGTYGGTATGCIVTMNDVNFYYAGDTALFTDMKLIATQAKIDFCFLPIGDNFTMDDNQAVVAADFLNCNKVIAMHYDTFGFIKVDHDQVKQTFDKFDKELYLMDIGGTLTL